jgi:Oxidoreductase molybdopterin binding domain
MSGRKAKHEYTASHATDAEVLAASRKLTRRGFAVAAIGAAAGFGFYRWVEYSRDDGMQPVPLRRAFQANAALSRKVFDERALAPTYPASRAENLRINGLIGIKEAILPESWRLQLAGAANEKHFAQYVPDVTAWTYEYSRGSESTEGDHFTFVPPEPVVNRGNPIQVHAGKRSRGLEEAGPSYSTVPAGTPGLLLRMANITRLPAHDLVTEFKCVEGWSQITHWSGVRMADFIDAYPPTRKPDGSLPRYVYMETPNGDYYVGYDMTVCRHPQTLLVTGMVGKPLTQLHGAPLRLHAPTKYGYKQIKRIGLIAYTDLKPDDYWTKLGYDWYAGL